MFETSRGTKVKSIIFCTLTLVLFFACAQKESVEDTYRKWYGKEIKFPSEIVFTIYGQDTISTPNMSGYKIFTYADSVGCMTCKMGFQQWKVWKDRLDSIFPQEIPLLIVMNTNKISKVSEGLRKISFDRPIIIDPADSFNILNQFSENDMFRTFLLDSANRIVAIGNPIHNKNIAKLYMAFLGIEDPLISNSYALNLGTFNWREPQTALFKIVNQSDAICRIDSITTSCECTTAKCFQNEVLPNDSLKVEVCYVAESASTFMREVYVHTNQQNEPITLTIEGSAVEQ